MPVKQNTSGNSAPDGSQYVTITDGAGNLVSPSGGTVVGSTSLSASSGNVAAASAVATLAGAANQTTYISGFQVTGAGATGASVISVTVAGLLGGTATYTMAIPAGVSATVQPLVVSFYPPLPASAANTSIVVTAPSFGAGNTNATVNAQGYRI